MQAAWGDIASPVIVGIGIAFAEWRAARREAKRDGRIEQSVDELTRKTEQHDQEFSTVKNNISDLRERVTAVETRCDERAHVCG